MKSDSQITNDNIYSVVINKKTKTISLFDDYTRSGKSILMIKHALSYKAHGITLIVDKWLNHTMLDVEPFPISDLKSIVYQDIQLSVPTRMRPLKRTIMNICENNKLYTDSIFLFKEAVPIGAQTSQNRTGYGNEYWGDYLLIKGTLYGEMTDFAVIGIKIETYNSEYYESNSISW